MGIKMTLDKNKVLEYAPLPVIAVAYFLLGRQSADAITLIRAELLLILGYVVAVSDIRDKKIPNEYIIVMLILWGLTVIPQFFWNAEKTLAYLLSAVLGLAISGGLFLLVYLVSRKGLGGGDVKFMAAAGLYLTYGSVIPAMLYGTLLSGLFALVMLALKRVGRKDAIPLAPFLYAGILLTLFLM